MFALFDDMTAELVDWRKRVVLIFIREQYTDNFLFTQYRFLICITGAVIQRRVTRERRSERSYPTSDPRAHARL